MRRTSARNQFSKASAIVPTRSKPPHVSQGTVYQPDRVLAAADRWMQELLGPPTHRHAVALLDQQMWCWGQDVRGTGQNGLVDFGFERFPPPSGLQTSSCYAWRDACGRQVVLWGFGIYFGRACQEGIFLRRYRFALTQLLLKQWPDPCWQLEELPTLELPESREQRQRATSLLIEALDWIAEYESWAQGTLGESHRQQSLSKWKSPCCAPGEIPAQWHQLAWTCRAIVDTASEQASCLSN